MAVPYRAIDQAGQVVDALLCQERDGRAARRFFVSVLSAARSVPTEVVTDKAPSYVGVMDELLPGVFHNRDRHANHRIEADNGLKARLRPMRGLKVERTAQVTVAGHAFVQNLRRGHYELGVEVPCNLRVAAAVAELTLVIRLPPSLRARECHRLGQCNSARQPHRRCPTRRITRMAESLQPVR